MKFYRLIRDVTIVAGFFSFLINVPVTVLGGLSSANEKIASKDAFSQGLVTADVTSMLSLTISDVKGRSLWAYITSSGLIRRLHDEPGYHSSAVFSSCAIIWWHCEQVQ